MVKSYPKVSIVTVSYNSVRTIEKTIQSVISQDYPNIEYIIIDGASNDGTVDIIKRYQGMISFWITEEDDGIADAFNKGIRVATGDIVGIINADDWYAPSAISTIVEVFRHNPNAGFIYGDLTFVDFMDRDIYVQKGDPCYLKTVKFDMPSVPHPTMFVHKNVYEKCGVFDTDYKTAMDYELLLRLTHNKVSSIYIPNVLAYMRLGGESDSNYIQGYYEVAIASIKYGYNSCYAYLRFSFKVIKTFVKKCLQGIGLSLFVKLYRKVSCSRYKY